MVIYGVILYHHMQQFYRGGMGMNINAKGLDFYQPYLVKTRKIYQHTTEVDLSKFSKEELEIYNKDKEKLGKLTDFVEYDFSKTAEQGIEITEDVIKELRELYGKSTIIGLSGRGAIMDKAQAMLEPIVEKKREAYEDEELKKRTAEMEEQWDALMHSRETGVRSVLLNHPFASGEGQKYSNFLDMAKYHMKAREIEEYEAGPLTEEGWKEWRQYRKEAIARELGSYASMVATYFNVGEAGEKITEKVNKEAKALSYQMADAILEYSERVQNGDEDFNHVEAKLTICGVDMTFGQLKQLQDKLYEMNEASNVSYTAYEEMGRQTAGIRKFCKGFLPKDAVDMVMNTYEKRAENTMKDAIEIDEEEAMLRYKMKLEITKFIAVKSGNNWMHMQALKEGPYCPKYKGSPMEATYKKYASMEL